MEDSVTILKKIRLYNGLSNFQKLKEIVKKMTHSEREIAEKYLSCFDSNKGKPITKYLELFQFMMENADSTEGVARSNFGAGKKNSFDMLVKRLKDKLGYVMANEMNTQRKDAYSPYFQEKWETRHLLTLYEIYQGRGLREEAYSVLNKCINHAKDFEAYLELTEALEYKRNHLKMRAGTEDFRELDEQILFYEKCRKAFNKARQYFNEHIPYVENATYRARFVQDFEGKLKEMAVDYAETKCGLVGYYYYLVKIEYLQELREYELAGKIVIDLLNLVKNNKAVYTRPRMGTVYMNLANNLIYQQRFLHAIEAVKSAANYYKPNTMNFSIIEELEFSALFYLDRFREAEAKISSIINNMNYAQSVYIDNKREYFYACTLFALGKYEQASKVLEKVSEIHKDKRGWNVGIRIMSILSNESKGDYELLHYKLESIRVHIVRMQSLIEVRKRDLLILSIIKDWVKEGKNFSLVWKKRQKDFAKLASTDPDFCWLVKSHELIVFHKWFECMVRKQPYQLDAGHYFSPGKLSAEKTKVKA